MTANRLNIVLYQPLIPQNTGSIARLCACIGGTLHLIHPLGFSVDDAAVRRAGLDYWPHVDVRNHESWEAFLQTEAPQNIYYLSKFAQTSYLTVSFPLPSYLVFGNESHGLPKEWRTTYADKYLKIPMRTSIVRSLNLAQSAAVVVYEVIRQNNLGPELV